MMIRRVLTMVCAVVCTVISPLANAAGLQFSPAEIETLARGELVVMPFPSSGKDSIIAGTSFVLINEPPEIAWRAIEDIGAWPAFFPNVHEAHVVALGETGKTVKMRIGNRLVKFGFYLTVAFDREKKEAFYALNKKRPHDIGETRGSLRLLAQPGEKTLVVFSALAYIPFAPLMRLMGERVIQWIEHRVLSVPERLKKWVESEQGAKYRTP